jgi:hypothetical protein
MTSNLNSIKTPIPSTLQSSINNQKTKNLSFFYLFYQLLKPKSKAISVTDEEQLLPPPFRTYDHPFETNWKQTWNTPPIVLDPEFIPDPILEFAFNRALFRLQLLPLYIQAFHKALIIHQFTTITFKGYESSHSRFIVEWCQWMDEEYAYLKVVGINSLGIPFSYNDPDYPTFILAVPICFTDVPIPKPIIPVLFPTKFEDIFTDRY